MRAVYTEWVDENKGIVTIMSSDTPVSLNITGADVDGLPDNYIVAAGSVIVTPDTNYIAFEDGVFTEKSNGGGGSDIVVTHVDEDGKLDKTFREIVDALSADKFVLIVSVDDEYTYDVYYVMQTYMVGEGDTALYCVNTNDGEGLSTDDVDGYPGYSGQGAT